MVPFFAATDTDRQRLNLVLSEQSLTLAGLTAPETRLRIGRLLGATVMISGSFVEHSQSLRITMRATDLETGIVTATAEGAGPAGRIGQLASQLYGRLSGSLDQQLPELRPEQIDQAPLANLHFLKGLGHYFSAHYSQALAEFMLAAEEKSLADISGLWLANTYLARAQYTHAYLELTRLRNFRPGDVAAKKLVCEQHLGTEDVRIIRELAARRSPGRK